MSKDLKGKVNDLSHKADDKVENVAAKYNVPKALVWTVAAALLIGGLKLTGII